MFTVINSSIWASCCELLQFGSHTSGSSNHELAFGFSSRCVLVCFCAHHDDCRQDAVGLRKVLGGPEVFPIFLQDRCRDRRVNLACKAHPSPSWEAICMPPSLEPHKQVRSQRWVWRGADAFVRVIFGKLTIEERQNFQQLVDESLAGQRRHDLPDQPRMGTRHHHQTRGRRRAGSDRPLDQNKQSGRDAAPAG